MIDSSRLRVRCALSWSVALLLVGSCSSHEEEDDAEEAEGFQTIGAATCGVERWSVKTGTDPDASSVGLTATNKTIGSLRALAKPATIPANSRLSAEKQAARLTNVTLTVFKAESDSDYHLVVRDGAATNTMIVEIPLPGCVGSGSPFAGGIASARAAFNAKFTPTTSFVTANIPVTVTGIPMFDFLHGQTGVAPNGIELHPVLSICFGTNCAGTPPPTTCAHDICSTGSRLASGCDPCVTRICAADSFCCSSSWDSVCVGEVSSVCSQACP